jgi:RNA polymerase sigma-70 factor (ECF subfamily)
MNDFSADVKLARQGSAEAFARLYSAVYKDMYHIALCSLRSSHDASDAVSEAVLDAFCTIGKLRDAESFRGWILKILSAKIKRKQRDYFDVPEDIDGTELSSGDFDFMSVELREAVGRLSGEERLLLSMSALGGYSSTEISRICGVKASTVRSRLAAIKERLRTELT